VNDLKDMLASLPQFQTQREQFSLHLDMAQECMALFEKKKLNVAAGVEQVSPSTLRVYAWLTGSAVQPATLQMRNSQRHWSRRWSHC